MSAATDILRVDTEGLSKLCSRNGLDWLGKELIQNAWDQDVTQVHLTIESVGHGRGRIIVTDDDPEGFLDLSHAYTLFAESNKKGNPLQRGRFNLGEKLVIAYCVETGGSVEILTTTGGFRFSKKDLRISSSFSMPKLRETSDPCIALTPGNGYPRRPFGACPAGVSR